jgi:hypothetical protein
MKEELKEIIKELKEVVIEEKLNILDKDLLEFSIRIMNTNIITINKPNNKLKNEQSPREYLENTGGNELATKNQISFLIKQGKPVPKGITKKEAYLLIKGIKENELK